MTEMSGMEHRSAGRDLGGLSTSRWAVERPLAGLHQGVAGGRELGREGKIVVLRDVEEVEAFIVDRDGELDIGDLLDALIDGMIDVDRLTDGVEDDDDTAVAQLLDTVIAEHVERTFDRPGVSIHFVGINGEEHIGIAAGFADELQEVGVGFCEH